MCILLIHEVPQALGRYGLIINFQGQALSPLVFIMFQLLLLLLVMADMAVPLYFEGGEYSFNLFLDFGDLHAILYLAEDINELLANVSVASGEAADLFEEGESDLVVLLDEHLVFALGAGVGLGGAGGGGCVAGVVLLVAAVPGGEAGHAEGVRVELLLGGLAGAA